MVLNASNIQSRGGGLAILIEMQTKFYDIFDPISVASNWTFPFLNRFVF